jgi:hypothetical protein
MRIAVAVNTALPDNDALAVLLLAVAVICPRADNVADPVLLGFVEVTVAFADKLDLPFLLDAVEVTIALADNDARPLRPALAVKTALADNDTTAYLTLYAVAVIWPLVAKVAAATLVDETTPYGLPRIPIRALLPGGVAI